MKYMDYFAYAMPFFVIAMILELIYQVTSKRRLYRFTDLISNLSCGMGQQAIDVFLKIFVIAGYKFIYDHFRLFTVPVNFLTSVILFILIDFSYYWFHRFAHRVNIMWGTHIVHHQSEEFNLSVALRQSWFDNIFNWFFYIPLAISGFDDIWFFALFSFNTIYQFIIHTKAINRLGILELFMNTPSHHRVHHGQNSQYIDKNYGGVFIVWDRLFGTFENEREAVVYGVTTPVYSTNPLRLNLSYWANLARNVKHISKAKNKLLYFLSPPNKPVDEAGTTFHFSSNVSKRLPTLSNSKGLFSLQTAYISANFLVLITILMILLNFKDGYDHLTKAQTTSFLIISLSMIGEIIDGKRWVRYLELIRIAMLFYISMLLIETLEWKMEYLCWAICILLLFLYYRAFLKNKPDEVLQK